MRGNWLGSALAVGESPGLEWSWKKAKVWSTWQAQGPGETVGEGAVLVP